MDGVYDGRPDGFNEGEPQFPDLNMSELLRSERGTAPSTETARRFNRWVVTERTRIEIEVLALRSWIPQQALIIKAALLASRETFAEQAPENMVFFCRLSYALAKRERQLRAFDACYLSATQGTLSEVGMQGGDENAGDLWQWFWAADAGRPWGEL